MASPSMLRRLLDAGVTWTEFSREAAQRTVGQFARTGNATHAAPGQGAERLRAQGRSSGARLARTARTEMAKQLGKVAGALEDIEQRIEGAVLRDRRPSPHSPASAAPRVPVTGPPAAGTPPAKKSAAKKSAAKKSAVTRVAAKTSAAKKVPAKTSAAKKVPAKTSAAKRSPER